MRNKRFKKLLELVKEGQTNGSWIADRFIEWCYVNPRTETTKAFLKWLEGHPEDKPISGFFCRGVYPSTSYEEQKENIEKFISDWVAKEDSESFGEYIKKLLLAKEYERMRERYKPEEIKCLLIAESPPVPNNKEYENFNKKLEENPLRFFYNPDKYKYDFLFNSIMEVIFPEFRDISKDISEDKKKELKGQYLDKFKAKGFYLIDAVDYPINDLSQSKRNKIIKNNLNNKIKEIKSLVNTKTPIILIKVNIYDIFEQPLRAHSLNVINDDKDGKDGKLPFPSSGRQNDFKEMFRRYLTKCLKDT